MNRSLSLTAACVAALAAGVAGAQTYSTYPAYGTGYDSQRVVRCESTSSRRNFCRVDTRGGVQLVRQLSRQSCIRGRNWQATSDGIAVSSGCRAEFVVNGNAGYQVSNGTYTTDRYGRRVYVDRYTNTRYENDGRNVHCQSNGHGRTYCGLRGSHYTMIDRSPSCVVNRTWGDDSYGTWVSGNCNADFSLQSYPVDQGYSRTDPYYDNRVYGTPTTVYSTGVYTPGTDPYYGQPTRYGADAVQCRSTVSGRTYCGDRNRPYTLRFDTNSGCLLNRTYGSDSYGTWVSGSCNLTMVPSGYDD